MSIYRRSIAFLKEKFDAIDNSTVRQNLLNALPFWVGAAITGLAAVFYAQLFHLAEATAQLIYETRHWLLFIVSPVCFVVAWWLVKKYAPLARGSGIPQVSASIDLANPKHHKKINYLLSLRIVIVKVISSLTMALGGGVIGREGPTIQIAGAIFKKINDLLPDWYPKVSKRNMIVTGSAAGLAAAFNTPLGGIVFAIEELTKTHISYFKSALLTGVIISGLTALNFLGPYLYLGFPKLDGLSPWILVIVIMIAVISGLAGGLMGRLVLRVSKEIARIKKNKYRVLIVMSFGAIIALTAFFFGYQAIGSGKEIMHETLFSTDKHLSWYTPLLRFMNTILSFTAGAAGGIFAPSLSAGASIGAVFSELLNLSNTDTNLIILCGMVGFLTGITRSPFTSSILVLEMTDSHNIIFYLMFTGLFSFVLANTVDRRSLYDHLKLQYLKEVKVKDREDRKTNKEDVNPPLDAELSN